MKTNLLIACALSLGFSPALTHATPIFMDDFESDTVGTEPANWDTVSGTDSIVVADGSVFGPTNQYAVFNDVGTGGLSFFKDLPAIDGIVSTFAFDYQEPTGAPNASVSLGYTTSGGDINASAAWRITLDDGAITFSSGEIAAGTKTYSLDTSYRFYALVNDTGSAVNYSAPGGGAETLGVGEIDFYYKNLSSSAFTFVGTGTNDTADVVGRLGFRTFSTGDQVFNIDNVLVTSGIVIPEPTTLALLLGGLGTLLAFQRRMRR